MTRFLVGNGLAWPIWTSAPQVMVKRKAVRQTGSLTPEHKKSRINPTFVRSGGVQHTIEKLLMRTTPFLQTSSQSEVWAKSYSPTKWREFEPWQFRDSSLGVPGQKVIQMWVPQRGTENTMWGKVVASLESGPWWVLWVQSHPWFVLALKVSCKFEWVTKSLSLFLVPSRSFSTPFTPF
jgi:hypothetical protein